MKVTVSVYKEPKRYWFMPVEYSAYVSHQGVLKAVGVGFTRRGAIRNALRNARPAKEIEQFEAEV